MTPTPDVLSEYRPDASRRADNGSHARAPVTPMAVEIRSLAIATLVLLLAASSLGFAEQPGIGATTQNAADEKAAIELCHAAVRAVLKTPSVAQFPNDRLSYQGAGMYSVSGSVDSQNSFGAMLRMEYGCGAVGGMIDSLTVDGHVYRR